MTGLKRPEPTIADERTGATANWIERGTLDESGTLIYEFAHLGNERSFYQFPVFYHWDEPWTITLTDMVRRPSMGEIMGEIWLHG